MEPGNPETAGLFSPYQYGGKQWELSHRIVMAPMTRCRAPNSIPNEAMVEYYSQRATQGGLIISEGTFISPTAHGYPKVPGIYTAEQVEAWKKVTAAVHSKGGVIFCQLWHVGRASHNVYQPGGAPPISSTNKKISSRWNILLPDRSFTEYSTPRALSTEEIPQIIDQFTKGAINALEAGFDGVECHGAYGYLIDQFLKDQVNDRIDQYGGSLENRIRLLDEIVRAVAKAVGPGKVGVKISPTLYHQDSADSDPLALGLAVVEKLNEIQEELGHHLAHVQIQVGPDRDGSGRDTQVVRAMRKKYNGAFMICGGYDRELGMKAVDEGDADLIGFARHFLANPDLVQRFKLNAPLNASDVSTYYTHDPVVGYTDYPYLHDCN